MGKIIVLEGTDSSGKETHTKLLLEKLKAINPLKREFPNYPSESSYFVRSYLLGHYGEDPDLVDPYIASMFFALDRFDTYIKEIKQQYDEGKLIVLDRYTTANMVHQASKIRDIEERDKYLEWLDQLEFNSLKLPRPDIVFFLDMPPEYSRMLSENRANKINGEVKKDIHESSRCHLEHAYESAHYVADKYGWTKIKCTDENGLRSIEDIQEDMTKVIGDMI